MKRMPRIDGLITIASPGSRRWRLFSEAWKGFWPKQDPAPVAQLVPWREVVSRCGKLDRLSAFDRPAVVRLESPGEDFEVTRLLLQAGEIASGGRMDWTQLEYQLGRLVRPGLLFRGFQRVLKGLHASFAARRHLAPLACPLAVAEMFDKNRTAARLTAAGLPCPEWFEPSADNDTRWLLDELRSRAWHTAYVKLAAGSSATGIAVVHAVCERPWALTSVLRRGGDFFNSLRIQRVEGDELARIVDFILREGASVQRGIPPAQIDGQNFDARVIVIDGRPAFTIFRLSSDPMTNLDFGGRRGRDDACRAAIPKRAWLDAMDDCTEAATHFDAAMVGIDLVFERGFMGHYLLEANAFGDFIPSWTDAEGRTIHQAEIESIAKFLHHASRARTGSR